MDISLIIFAFLSFFVIWRLWTILGKRPENTDRSSLEVPPSGLQKNDWQASDKWRVPQNMAEGEEPIAAPVQLKEKWAPYIDGDNVSEEILQTLSDKVPSFDPKTFLEESTLAYEKIVKSYTIGDLESLSSLLTTKVYDEFVHAIQDRQNRGEQEDALLVALDKPKIKEISITPGEIAIQVRFNAQLIRVIKDQAGNMIAGDPKVPQAHTDLWSFSRPLSDSRMFGAGTPVWRLSATQSV